MKRRAFLKGAASTFILPSMGILLGKQQALADALTASGLKELYKDCFLMGTMVPLRKYLVPEPGHMAIVRKEFNSLATQNVFKWGHVHPAEGEWNWAYTDRFVDFAEANGMHVVGHHLVAGSDLPTGLLLSAPDKIVDEAVLRVRLENHVSTLVDRYKGRVHAWDVVNEAVDDFEQSWLRNAWFNILGPEYVERSFQLAREADPKATLIYNDYNLSKPSKREFVTEMLRDFKHRGVPIDAIGLQGHFSLDGGLEEFEASIEAFYEAGARIHISELEVDVLPPAPLSVEQVEPEVMPALTQEDVHKVESTPESMNIDPFKAGLPEDTALRLKERYAEIFNILIKHKDKIDRVTFWGATDDDSWKNDFPVVGRVNHPLLFDRSLNKKSAYDGVADLKK